MFTGVVNGGKSYLIFNSSALMQFALFPFRAKMNKIEVELVP